MNRKKKLVDAINQAYSNKKRLYVRFEPIKTSGYYEIHYAGWELNRFKEVVVGMYNSDLTSDTFKIVDFEVVE